MITELSPSRLSNLNLLPIELANRMAYRLEVVLPVEVCHPETDAELGRFRASFIKEGSAIFLQVEDFDTPEFTESFFNFFNGDWVMHPGGIYRLEFTKTEESN